MKRFKRGDNLTLHANINGPSAASSSSKFSFTSIRTIIGFSWPTNALTPLAYLPALTASALVRPPSSCPTIEGMLKCSDHADFYRRIWRDGAFPRFPAVFPTCCRLDARPSCDRLFSRRCTTATPEIESRSVLRVQIHPYSLPP